MADTEELCAKAEILNIEDFSDETKKTEQVGNDMELNDDIHVTSNLKEKDDEEKSPPVETPSQDYTADAHLDNKPEVDDLIDSPTVEPDNEDKKPVMVVETKEKISRTKFKTRSLGITQGETTLSPQSFIDVPDYGYSIDGAFQGAW